MAMPNSPGNLSANLSQAISQDKNLKCKYCESLCVFCVCNSIYLRFLIFFFLKNPGSKTLWACISQVSKIPASWPVSVSFWIPYTSPPTSTCRFVVCSDPVSVKARTESLRRTRRLPSVWRALCGSHKCHSSMAHLDGHCKDSPQ